MFISSARPRRAVWELLEARCLLSAPAGFTETLVAGGLARPTAMDFAPDGRLFVSQQGGQLRVVKNGALLPQPFVSLPADANGERGLLGVTFDPNFNANHFVYVYWTTDSPAPHNRISRFTASGDVAARGSETDLLDLPNLSSATNHNGGSIHFGADGKLYVGVGENANGANAQSLNTVLGKILRFNSDGSIPTDNPFYSQTSGINRAIWALGVRNPFTFAVQPGTGRIFIDDVGLNAWEEIDEGAAGANYGWPLTEGNAQPGDTRPANYHDPLYAYVHSAANGDAITAGTFYNPVVQQFPAQYAGEYFFADLSGGYIKTFDFAHNGAITPFATNIITPVSLNVGPDGSLYYLSHGTGASDGGVSKFTYAPSVNNLPPVPVITGPAIGTLFSSGETITYTGEATDPQDGALPPGGLTWHIDYFAGGVDHPFVAPITNTGGGQFNIPTDPAYAQPSVFFRIFLTATDSAGLATTVFRDIQPRASTTGNGLTATYFDNSSFTGQSVTRIDAAIDFDWGLGSPDPSIGPDTFSTRWTGKILAPKSETYTFTTTTDDGVRLWVNGKLIVNQLHNKNTVSGLYHGSIRLTAGRKYSIRMDYFENTGHASARLAWSSPTTPQQIVPTGDLFPT